MGSGVGKATQEAVPHLNVFKESLGDIVKMGAGFAFGQIITSIGQSLPQALEKSIDFTKEFYGEVKTLMNVTGGTAEELSTTVAAFERFGVSSDRAASSLSIFARQIARAPVDVTELATGLTDAGKPLKGFADQMHDLGINTEDATGKARPILDVFYDTADAFQRMGKGQDSAAAAMTIFGRAGRDMLPLLQQGSAGIKEVAEEAAKLGMQLTTSNMAQIKSFSDANKDMGEAMNGLKLQVGVALMPVLTQLAQTGAKLAQIFNENLMPAIRTVGDWITKISGNVQEAWKNFTDWLGPLGQVVDKLKELATNVIDANGGMDTLSDGATNVTVALAGGVTAVTAFTFAASAASDAMGFLSNAFTVWQTIAGASSLMTVVLALAVFVALLVTAYNNVAWFKDIVNALATAFTSDVGALAVIHDVLLATFGEDVASKIEPLLDFLYNAIPLLTDLWNALVETFTGDSGALGVVYDLIRKIFGDGVAEFLQPFLEFLRLMLPQIKSTVGALFGDLGTIFDGIGSVIRDVLNGDFGAAFHDFGSKIIKGFKDGLNDFANLGHFFLQLLEGQGGLLGAFAQLEDLLLTVWQTVWNVVMDVLQGDFEGAGKDLKEGLGKAFEHLGDAQTNLSQALQGIGTFLLNWIKSEGPVILLNLVHWAYNFYAWVTEVAPPLLTELGKLIGRLWDWIKQQVPPLVTRLVEWGKAFIAWIAPQIPPFLLEVGKIAVELLGWIFDQTGKIAPRSLSNGAKRLSRGSRHISGIWSSNWSFWPRGCTHGLGNNYPSS